MIKGLPADVIHYEIIPDEKEMIIEALEEKRGPIEGGLNPHNRGNRFESPRCDAGCNVEGD